MFLRPHTFWAVYVGGSSRASSSSSPACRRRVVNGRASFRVPVSVSIPRRFSCCRTAAAETTSKMVKRCVRFCKRFSPPPPFSQHAPRKAPKTTPSPPPCCLDTYSGPCPPRTTGRVGHYYLAREKRYDPPVPRPSCDVTVGGATDEYPPAPCRTRFVPYTVGAYAIIRLIDNIVAYA